MPKSVINLETGRLHCYCDPVTATIAVAALAGGAQAVEARKQRKAAQRESSKQQALADEAVKKQEALAAEEKQSSDTELASARERVLRGKRGTGSLLFGSELGVNTSTTKKQTLGA